MDNGRKAFVKTDGRSSDQAATSADESGKKLAHESETDIVIALPCEMCEELCPSDKLIDRLQCRKERENAKRSELKDTLFQAQEFAFNECSGTGDSLPVHGVRK